MMEQVLLKIICPLHTRGHTPATIYIMFGEGPKRMVLIMTTTPDTKNIYCKLYSTLCLNAFALLFLGVLTYRAKLSLTWSTNTKT